MRSYTVTRGVALGVALLLALAPVAGAASGRTTPGAATPHATTSTAAAHATTTSTTALAPASAAVTTSTGENTALNLGGKGDGLHTAASSSDGSSILRTIVALAIVIAIIYAIARILRAIKGRSDIQASGQGLTQLATLPLGAGRSLALVRSGRDIVLVGVAESGVTPIKSYTEAEARAMGIDVPAEMAIDVEEAEQPFGRVLDQLRKLTVRS
jgi:flagellar protein FliO/FliZ